MIKTLIFEICSYPGCKLNSLTTRYSIATVCDLAAFPLGVRVSRPLPMISLYAAHATPSCAHGAICPLSVNLPKVFAGAGSAFGMKLKSIVAICWRVILSCGENVVADVPLDTPV